MQSTLTTPGGPAVQVPVMVAAELQDSLLVVMHDLHRLEGLLNHATDNLLERSGAANATSEAMGHEEGEDAAPFAEMAPDRPNPVTQSEMDAGSVDLF